MPADVDTLPRSAFTNQTNVRRRSEGRPTTLSSFFLLGSAPEKRVLKRRRSDLQEDDVEDDKVTKNQGKSQEETIPRDAQNDSDWESESEPEERDVALTKARARKRTVFSIFKDASTRQSGRQPLSLPARPILQSYVSSHKTDVYKCHSVYDDGTLTLPYACAYANGAKKGTSPPLFAVATEQGTINVLNTAKRSPWDYEPQRTVHQPHQNGIFSLRWSPNDALLASTSGDRTCVLSAPTPAAAATPSREFTTMHTLVGHTSTVKCAEFLQGRDDLLCTGARDGEICIWDLRVAGGGIDDDEDLRESAELEGIRTPVKIIEAGTPGVKRAAKTKMGSAGARSVTSLVYSDALPHGIISSGSVDGILHYHDLRVIPSATGTNPKSTKSMSLPTQSSYIDPTFTTSPRPRGIVSLTPGTGPTSGLLFGLSIDSKIHTYALPSLNPLPPSPCANHNSNSSMNSNVTYGHEKMQSTSFYVKTSLSPCGRYLASGSSSGRVFLFDVSNTGRDTGPSSCAQQGVELFGQKGEVGAIDWAAHGIVAGCADDGSVRVWRPDLEISRICRDDPEEERWNWSWADESRRE